MIEPGDLVRMKDFMIPDPFASFLPHEENDEGLWLPEIPKFISLLVLETEPSPGVVNGIDAKLMKSVFLANGRTYTFWSFKRLENYFDVIQKAHST